VTAIRRTFAAFALLFAFAAPALAAPVQGYQVVKTYPHRIDAFTEGLFYKDGVLFESTGLEGASSIRKVKLETGEIIQAVSLPKEIFGEGLIWEGDHLINLTWKSEVGLIVDINSFQLKSTFKYKGEGWGLTRNDREILMSDGTSEIRRLNPKTLAETGRIKVTDNGKPVTQLNELEWIKGEIWANVWQTDRVARIDPATGKVKAWVDFKGLLDRKRPDAGQADVLNGIAYDAKADRIFVTGKNFPLLYEIKTKPAR
jgi:glutamine cyclotransferase